jgi:hypothetical protein
MKKIHLILLIIIILGAITTRAYKFDNPIADWHAWRQADTSSVSRNFIKNGFDILHPRYNDISNIQSGKDNPNGYRFVEFPIYNIFQASLYKIFGNLTLIQWGRIVSIISSILSLLFIYLLVKKYANTTAALFSAAFYAFLPFNIYYGRSILPDPTMVMASLGGIYFFDKWLSSCHSREGGNPATWLWFSLSVTLTSSALLLKPYAIFFTLPIIYLALYKLGLKFYKKWQLYLYLILAITPLILWRLWMTQFPEGIPANEWLLNGGNIRFKGSFFYWIFADRIGRLILGYWGLVIFSFGLAFLGTKKHLSKNFFFLSFLISSLLYITIIARGNVQHDYYQILIIPSLAIFLGLGSYFLLNLPKENFHKSIGIIILSISSVFTFFFSWYYVRDYFNINNPSIISAGSAVDKLTPKDSKVIAILHGSEGDTTFLYQTNRQGWPSFEKPLPEMINMGADYLIFANPQKEDMKFSKDYKLVTSTPDYIIFDLHRK